MAKLFWTSALHARHGLAIVHHYQERGADKRYREKTFGEYSNIIEEIDKFLKDEVRLTIKDRVDLHHRWLNSMERSGDCMMLMQNRL